jgi:flagellar biosynthetic protein FliP
MAATTTAPSGTVWWSRGLLRHYLEMVVAMFVGMGVFGGLFAGAVAVLGLDVELSTTAAALKMAVDMALGMVVWMRVRGHGWAGTLEMAGAMLAVPLALLPLVGAGVLDGDGFMMVEHVVMFPVMYLVMVRRHHEYGH